MFNIIKGKRPPRPDHPAFTPGLWELMQRCWDQESHSRPEMLQVLQALLSSSVSFSPPGSAILWLNLSFVCRDSSPDENAQPSITVSPDSLQRMHTLEKSSPQFPEHLAGILDEKEFKEFTESLQDERLAILVNELDNVRPYDLFLPFFYLQYSSSISLTPLVLLFQDANANSGGYAVLVRYCQNHTQFRTLHPLAPGRSPLGPLLMFTKEASTILRSLSNRRGFIQTMTHMISERRVVYVSPLRFLFPHRIAAILPGGRCMEASEPSKHRSLPGYH